MFNLQTKFEMSSFIRTKDMAWAPKCRNALGDSQASQGLILHAANLRTKFEDSSFSRSRDISMGVKL